MTMPPHPFPAAPGVYVQEAPSSDRTIVGVSTSVTAFVGFMRRQKKNDPLQVSSMADVERIFGPVVPEYLTMYSLLQFFRNGGQTAWIVNASPEVLPVATTYATDWEADVASTGVVTLSNQKISDTEFLFKAVERGESAGKTGITRQFTLGPLSTLPTSPNYAVGYGASTPGIFAWVKTIGTLRDAGTTGTATDLSLLDANGEDARPRTLRVFVGDRDLDVRWEDVKEVEVGTLPRALHDMPSYLEAVLRRAGVRNPAVTVTYDGRLNVTLRSAGTAADLVTQQQVIRFAPTPLALALGLAGEDVSIEPQATVIPAAAAPALPTSTTTQLTDAIGLCEKIDIFNIMCVPDVYTLATAADATTVLGAAAKMCLDKMAFLIADILATTRSPQDAQDYFNALEKSDYASIYFPALIMGDPSDDFRPKAVPSSGTLAGLYARIDANRGVWKAPAGIDTNLVGVTGMTYKLNDAENGTLNPLGINALRILTQGNVAWGARTMRGADLFASQWKYIPVRRLALYIEQSLKRGLVWAVFEPNFAPLWQSITLSVSSFMQTIFVQGGFAGTTPGEAYFVQCGPDTTSPTDIDQGWVNVIVGFAPLKPAEFVIVSFRQMTKSAAQ